MEIHDAHRVLAVGTAGVPGVAPPDYRAGRSGAGEEVPVAKGVAIHGSVPEAGGSAC